MITSYDNQAVKHIVRLREKHKYRKAQQAFIVEGLKMVREIPDELFIEVYVTPSFCENKDNQAFLHKLPSYQMMTEQVLIKAAGTKTPQGILAIVSQKEYNLKHCLTTENAIIIMLEGIQDPGNLGTIIRTAEAAGAVGIVMSSDTADIYNPKVIRSTMGSIFRMPFVYVNSLIDALAELKKQGFTSYAAHLSGAEMYTDILYSNRAVLLIGNEGNGLTKQLTCYCDNKVKLPMHGKVESLNAAIAASIFMYEIDRQRR